jgi:FKBP-type peptidyl-prolyl cis-trans isomerase
MRIALCALAAAALIAGCGGSKSTSSTKASSTTARTTPAARHAPPAGVSLPNMYRMPSPPPPHPGAKVQELVVKDIVRGSGQTIRAGDTAVVEFVLSDYNTGRLIEKSWGKKKPYAVRIERNVVIDGWWQGVPGMRVGGRRVLIIPPTLGFVNNPNPDVANRTTYFDIVLLGIVRAAPGEGVTGPGGSAQ